MNMCSFDDFKNIKLVIGKIMEAERVERSEKLLNLKVDLGERDEEGKPRFREILSGIGKVYIPDELLGREVVVVSNLEPRSLMGVESQGMLLATSDESGIVLLRPERDVTPGSSVS